METMEIEQEPLEKPEEKPEEEDRRAPLLDLSDATAHETVKLRDGSLREIFNLADFGAVDGQAVRRDGAEFRRLWDNPEELDDVQKDRLKFLIDRLFLKVLDAPEGVKKRVKDGDRAQIVLVFTGASNDAMMEALRYLMVNPQTLES